MTNHHKHIGLLICLLSSLLVAMQVFAAPPDHAVVGVDTWYTPPGMTEQKMIGQLANNGVKTIRRALYAGNTDFTIQEFRRGIGT